jgi:hypothetical protein
MNQALYAHMNNKRKMKKKINKFTSVEAGTPFPCFGKLIAVFQSV